MFVSRKKQKNTLLRTIEIAIEMGDVQSAQSLFEDWKFHFRLNGKKYKKRLDSIRKFLTYSIKIENEFGPGVLMKLDHPDIQKSIQNGIISHKSIEFYRKNKLAFEASTIKST